MKRVFQLALSVLILLAISAYTVPDDTVVYVTPSGAKYHREDCSYISENATSMTIAEAENAGYTPCSRCKPDEDETVSDGEAADTEPESVSVSGSEDSNAAAEDGGSDTETSETESDTRVLTTVTTSGKDKTDNRITLIIGTGILAAVSAACIVFSNIRDKNEKDGSAPSNNKKK